MWDSIACQRGTSTDISSAGVCFTSVFITAFYPARGAARARGKRKRDTPVPPSPQWTGVFNFQIFQAFPVFRLLWSIVAKKISKILAILNFCENVHQCWTNLAQNMQIVYQESEIRERIFESPELGLFRLPVSRAGSFLMFHMHSCSMSTFVAFHFLNSPFHTT